MQKKKILHITTHLGGGVGKVLLNYFSEVRDNNLFSHMVACLNYVDSYARATAERIGLPFMDMMAKKKSKLLKAIEGADIVAIHWWNHPLLYDFLVKEELPPSRIVIWSHVSGFYSPSVFVKKIIIYPDLFVFTTPISFDTNEVRSLPLHERDKLRVVWSTAGIKKVALLRKRKHSGFNIGYVGTVDYAKLHPHFLHICKKINIPGVKFIVCGGTEEEKIKKEALKIGLDKKIEFTGWVPDVSKYFSLFDVFGYPLNPSHFGTCDQSLQESMAAGIVPVVFENRMECSMVKNGITGIVAKSEDDYIQGIERLYRDNALRNFLSRNAQEYALRNFSIEKMVAEWEEIFSEVLTLPKKKRKWPMHKKKISNKDVFLESIAGHEGIFGDYCNAESKKKKMEILEKIKELGAAPIWQSESKGTVHNYNIFLPGDKTLSLWSSVMKVYKNHDTL